jgi:Protein of unknown function (DUF3570)
MKRVSVGKRRRGRCPTSTGRPAALPFALLLLLAAPRPAARAEDAFAYKIVDYQETGGRVDVLTQVASADEDIGPDFHLGVTLINDAISGASPTGVRAPAGSDQVPVETLTDHRKAWEVDLARQFERVRATVGVSESREHDYVSRGASLNTLTDFNEKNTTLLTGVAGHDDDVKTYTSPARLYLPKHVFDAILGVTQLLDPRTSVTLNVSWGRETGDLNDQYKLVEKTEELVPGSFFPLAFLENLPDTRSMADAYASINRSYPGLGGALEASYRFYGDTFGIVANTVEVQWLQKVGTRLTVAPNLRFYEQNAADFYYYNLDDTSLAPTHVPNPDAPHYSSDYRLSSLYAVTGGLKMTYKWNDRLQMDVAYDQYRMRGRDGVTPQSAYPVANILSAGAKISW